MIYDVKPLENNLKQELRDLREHVKSQPELTLIVSDNDLNDDDLAYIRSIERIMKKFDISIKTVHQLTKDNLDIPKITSPFIKIKSDMYTEHLPTLFDLDGSGYMNNGLMFTNNSNLYYHNPCTAEAIMTILHDIEERYFDNYKFQDVSVFGRGKVGLPTALLMTRDDRTVTVLHSKSSKGLFKNGLLNSVLIFATGHKDIVNENYIFNNIGFVYPSVIIDAGINVDEDGKIVGDINPEIYEKLQDNNPYTVITPVPGGVGRITPLILVKHILTAYK